MPSPKNTIRKAMSLLAVPSDDPAAPVLSGAVHLVDALTFDGQSFPANTCGTVAWAHLFPSGWLYKVQLAGGDPAGYLIYQEDLAAGCDSIS
jgi:hypothetical protein